MPLPNSIIEKASANAKGHSVHGYNGRSLSRLPLFASRSGGGEPTLGRRPGLVFPRSPHAQLWRKCFRVLDACQLALARSRVDITSLVRVLRLLPESSLAPPLPSFQPEFAGSCPDRRLLSLNHERKSAGARARSGRCYSERGDEATMWDDEGLKISSGVEGGLSIHCLAELGFLFFLLFLPLLPTLVSTPIQPLFQREHL